MPSFEVLYLSFLGRGVCDSRGTEWDLCVNVGIARTGSSSWNGRISLEGEMLYFGITTNSSTKTSIFFVAILNNFKVKLAF